MSIWIDDGEFPVFLAGQVPVTDDDDVIARFREQRVRGGGGGDGRARSLELLEELSAVLTRVGTAFRAAAGVHGGQLSVKDEPVGEITNW